MICHVKLRRKYILKKCPTSQLLSITFLKKKTGIGKSNNEKNKTSIRTY